MTWHIHKWGEWETLGLTQVRHCRVCNIRKARWAE